MNCAARNHEDAYLEWLMSYLAAAVVPRVNHALLALRNHLDGASMRRCVFFAIASTSSLSLCAYSSTPK
jgi:hypothetical protein